jgi:hypothetical protein
MPLARQRTYVGVPRGANKRVPYKRNVVRKTSKRGAYKKGKKKQMAIRRAPFVETKRKDDEQVLASGFFSGTGALGSMFPNRTNLTIYDTEHLLLDPYSYLLWSQGLDQAQHIGQAVNLKYTNMKIQVRFPQPSEEYYPGSKQEFPDSPMEYELIWGWVPSPLQLTGATTPAANVVTIDDIRNHINHRVTDYVNSKKDKLRFIPKKDATIRIQGRRKVRPDLRHYSTLQQNIQTTTASGSTTGHEVVGTVPDFHTEISWKHNNRKLWLEQTGNINGAGDLIAMYPNYSWLPFCTLVNWQHEDIPVDGTHGRKAQCPSVAWNSITYFSDS